MAWVVLDPDPLSWFFPVALLSLSPLLFSLSLRGPWVAGQTGLLTLGHMEFRLQANLLLFRGL